MKMKIDVGHGWCGAMSRCENCTEMFVVIRQRKNPVLNIKCPLCGMPGKTWHMETPWSGVLEVECDGEHERS